VAQAVRIQRQRRILKQRLKVPPTLHQFTRTLDKNLGMLHDHMPAYDILCCSVHA
jgi:hypothetical protein